MGREEMRASDSDRQAVADKLKTALDEGRLDLHEYDERLQQTYAAKTFGALDPLVTDLPGPIPVQQSQVQPYQAAAAPQGTPEAGEMAKPGGPPFWASYGGVVAVCFVIWAITCFTAQDWMYPWPVWMLIPLIFGLMSRARRGR